MKPLNSKKTAKLTILELDATEQNEKASYKTTIKAADIIRCWKRTPYHQTWISLTNGEKLLVEAEYETICKIMEQ